MSIGKQILYNFQKKWKFLLVAQITIYALGPSLLCYFLIKSSSLALLVFALIFIVGLLVKKPWQLTLPYISNYIDATVSPVEYSTSLLLTTKNQLTDLGKLRRYQLNEILKKNSNQLQVAISFREPLLVLGIFIIAAFFAFKFNWGLQSNPVSKTIPVQEHIVFMPLDSGKTSIEPPRIIDQQLQITYPSYTEKTSVVTKNMNIKVLEGSILSWSLQFNPPPKEVFLELLNEVNTMSNSKNGYKFTKQLQASGFYNFRFVSSENKNYESELFAIELIEDEKPTIAVKNLEQFTSFDVAENKILKFETFISDDYGISDAYILATVSKGEGEAVKFREEKVHFQEKISIGNKKQNLNSIIDLDQLKMTAGDELYFYIEAIDTKSPQPNIVRSETFFAVIRDTISNQFAVEGTMGADLMPDYFRSQRQLIIDTEKLIANKATLAKKEFNFTSNELGFDQKALRLKYGKFMGDETESAIQVNVEVEASETSDNHEKEDILEKYTHDHDGSNEHNLVDHSHNDEEEAEVGEDNPLENYLHNHDDPEESTLFTQSLKSKLRQAMAEMWDAELYLRLYTPEKSLPYQYRALKLIQEIKNSARIYVHRIGFDPPPIKEDKRLTGELNEVVSFQKQENIEIVIAYPFLKKAVKRIEELIQGEKPTESDKNLFKQAGNELAELAILQPSKHLKTLQQLKLMSGREIESKKQLQEVFNGILSAIPPANEQPSSSLEYESKLNLLLLKELEIND